MKSWLEKSIDLAFDILELMVFFANYTLYNYRVTLIPADIIQVIVYILGERIKQVILEELEEYRKAS